MVGDRDVQHWLVLVRKFQLCGKVIKGFSFLLQRRLRNDPTREGKWTDLEHLKLLLCGPHTCVQPGEGVDATLILWTSGSQLAESYSV